VKRSEEYIHTNGYKMKIICPEQSSGWIWRQIIQDTVPSTRIALQEYLDHGFSINCIDSKDMTILMASLFPLKIDIYLANPRYLTIMGADPYLKNKAGKSAIDIANEGQLNSLLADPKGKQISPERIKELLCISSAIKVYGASNFNEAIEIRENILKKKIEGYKKNIRVGDKINHKDVVSITLDGNGETMLELGENVQECVASKIIEEHLITRYNHLSKTQSVCVQTRPTYKIERVPFSSIQSTARDTLSDYYQTPPQP
jgi:hypothetical protein